MTHHHLVAVRRSRLIRLLRDLRNCTAGVSLTEFALCLPILVTLGMYGTEIAYLASVRMQVSEIAMSVGDNAARLGQTDNSGVTPTITERDVDTVLGGALRQGAAIDLGNRGRIVLSSLEMDATSKRQYVHWQRCRGLQTKASAYAVDVATDSSKSGLTGAALPGMGRPGHQITSPPNSAVMFVEVYYVYKGLFGDMFVKNRLIKQEAALLVRDDRNLTPGIATATSKSKCTTYTAT